MLGRALGRDSSEILDGIGHHVRRAHIETERPHERADELTGSRAHVRIIAMENRRELRRVFLERSRDRQQPAIDQIVEMQGAFLVRPEFIWKNREHRTAGDARLDEGAGVQAGNRRAVVERVEVVRARFRVDRIVAPHRQVRDAAPLDIIPVAFP